jgi:hypothetical protein
VASLPKRFQAIEAKLAHAKDRVEKAKAAIKADEMARRKYESDIKSQQDKIVKFREQSSSVKTNEQYKALLHEIEGAEKEIRSLEDKILETMEDAENKEREQKAAEAALKNDAVEVEKEKAAAKALSEEDEKRLTELRSKQTALRAQISEESLRHYDRIAKHRKTGVAEAREQRCMACQVMMRPQVFADVRAGEIIRACESCSRLLYYVPENAPEAGPKLNTTVERTWMFLPQMGERGAFVVFVNHKGTAQMRVFDAETGRFVEKHTEKGKSYSQAFKHQMEHGRELFVDQAGLEDEKEQLPDEALEDLRKQVPQASESAPSVTGE